LPLDKKTYHKIYNYVSMKFRRIDKKNWKTDVKLEGLTFKEYLKRELTLEEKRQQLNLPERHEVKAKPKLESPDISHLLPESDSYPTSWLERQLQKTEKTEKQDKDNMQYGDLDKILRQSFGSPEKFKSEKEALKRSFNEYQIREATKNICPICKSSVCHCSEESE